MNDDSSLTWNEHWQRQHVPWDAGDSAPALLELLESQTISAHRGKPPEACRALVPGCGRGYDVFHLAHHGFDATGLELAPAAQPHFERERNRRRLDPGGARLVVADFFAWQHQPFDFVWDYTFYCAIDPGQRAAWKSKMLELLVPGGLLATLIFPVRRDRTPDSGPPYPLDPQELKARLGVDFTALQLTPVIRSHEGREGKEWLGLWQKVRKPSDEPALRERTNPSVGED